MPLKSSLEDLPMHPFECAADFEAFLAREHLNLPGIYLKLARKSSGIPSISAEQAVEVALCFGWIDGRANSIDEKWWSVRYTPRRAKSIWSKKNVNTVARLLEENRIRPAGIAAVNAAKADGRWERAYAGPATITVPDDLAAALASEPAAAEFFASLNRRDRYSVLWRVETASVQSRSKRIEAVVETLTTGVVPGGESKQQKKTRKKTASNGNVTGPSKGKDKAIAKGKVSKSRNNLVDSVERPRRPGLRDRPM